MAAKEAIHVDSIIELSDISLSFGGLKALNDVSFNVKKHEILAIIGPNGAGKTSILNCISGFYQPQRGGISFFGEDIGKLSPAKRAKMGISRTFQNIELYAGLSVLDNLMAARHFFIKYGAIQGCFFFGRARKEEVRHRHVIEEIIDLLEIQEVRHKVVESLAYGLRKRVDLGRALALEPKFLLLDEPMAGMNVEEKGDMARFILDIRELKHIPIIIIEHDMGIIMDIADRILVLDFGKKIAEGTPSDIKSNEDVIKAYLGK